MFRLKELVYADGQLGTVFCVSKQLDKSLMIGVQLLMQKDNEFTWFDQKVVVHVPFNKE